MNTLTKSSARFGVDERGYYGEFGGAFIPEMLYPNVERLRETYREILGEEEFQREFTALLRDFVGRPTPLYFARRLSDFYKTKIYLKREDLNHTGAHKINNAIGQILLAKRLGKTRIIAETGAGQHGVATATACAQMGLECVIYMGAVDIERQKPNVERMKLLGASVVPALSGSQTLKDATNEAMRDWITNPENTHYIIGSVVGPHPYPDLVARFQSVISEEIARQLAESEAGRSYPDYVLACVGGGSNAIGAFYHFLDDERVRLIAIEAAGKGVHTGFSAATTALGKPGVLHGSKTYLMQTPDGQVVEPFSISAGLDYPGVGPVHAHLFTAKRAEFHAITDEEALQAGKFLARAEGIIPALETAHALAYLEKLGARPDEIVVLNLSGRGDKDLQTYINGAHERGGDKLTPNGSAQEGDQGLSGLGSLIGSFFK
jgi:tryptophan synthase beta chain